MSTPHSRLRTSTRLALILWLALLHPGCGNRTELDARSLSVGNGGMSGLSGASNGGSTSPSGGTSFVAGGASSESCVYKGITYQVDETFWDWDADPCLHCTCYGSGYGFVACSSSPCMECRVQSGTNQGALLLIAGDSIPAGDGCNTCTCLPGSRPTGIAAVSCTQRDCVGSCSYAGTMHANKDSFAATDGCNTCTCSNGSVLCTKNACACEPALEYWRDYSDMSPNGCDPRDLTCPEGSAPFGNACGCGCEQSVECPAYFDCWASPMDDMPPAPDRSSCATSALFLKCPLTPLFM